MFQDSIVVITGGVQGIGRGVALAYAKSRAKVVITDSDPIQGQQLESELQALE